MNFTVSSALLSSRVLTISRVLTGKSAINILNKMLFELRGTQLTITGSDGELTLATTIEVVDTDHDGQFAVDADVMVRGVKEMSDQPLTFEVNDETFAARLSYQNGYVNFVAEDGAPYPHQKGPDEGTARHFTIAATQFADGLTHAIFASADDDLRPVMNGVYVDGTGDCVAFVASDGHKLVRDRFLGLSAGEPLGFNIPKKTAKQLKDILQREAGDVTLKLGSNAATVTMESYVLTTLLLEGSYPNYNSVIPADNPYKVRVDRQAFVGAVRRVSTWCSKESGLLRLHAESDQLTIKAMNPDYSTSGEERVLCEYDGQPMTIGFKSTFIVDIVSQMASDEVIISLADPSRAALFLPATQAEGEDYLTLLMPMMVND